MVPCYPKCALHQGNHLPIHRKAKAPPSPEASGGIWLIRLARLCLILGLSGVFLSGSLRERMFRVMSRFLSNATNRIDAKGRVSVPSAFRSVLAQCNVQELYCFQDFVFPAISVGGPDLLERFERQIAAEDPFSPDANAMSLLIHGGGVFMKLDAEGRLMVTDFIRDFTGISDEVTFVGRADHFQLWQPQAFLAAQAQAREERKLAGKRS
ncbi:MraZ protein [Rhizobium etli CFN 42]|uniref:Transcriptional regulator MraZ n=2 Tax=Rhizobium etli TaxID=29449 RepID=Q2K6B2_RHIEC|nr:MraZ protein [Rhizobium etli CFN 42]